MTIPREVDASDILKTAMSMVRSAQKSVQATMQAAEELEHPLPRGYFLLLGQKLDQGVQLERLGFGSAAEFDELADRIHFNSQNYTFRRTDDMNYRRLLLVDDSKLLFVSNDTNGRHVYYTEDPNTIIEYKSYFTEKQRESRNS